MDQHTNEIPKQGWPRERPGFWDRMRWGTFLPISGSIVYNDRYQRRRKTKSSVSVTVPKKREDRDRVLLFPQLRSLGILHGASGSMWLFFSYKVQHYH